MQFLLALGGRGWEEQEASALLSKKGLGREGSIESQQKFDFFCYDFKLKREGFKKKVIFITLGSDPLPPPLKLIHLEQYFLKRDAIKIVVFEKIIVKSIRHVYFF